MPEGGIHQMKQGHSVFHGCWHRRIWVVSRRGLFSATEAKLGGGHNCSPESFEIMVYVSPMCAVMDTKKLMLKLASVLYESLWRRHLLGFQNKTFGVTGVRQRDKIQPQIKCAKKFWRYIKKQNYGKTFCVSIASFLPHAHVNSMAFNLQLLNQLHEASNCGLYMPYCIEFQ